MLLVSSRLEVVSRVVVRGLFILRFFLRYWKGLGVWVGLGVRNC